MVPALPRLLEIALKLELAVGRGSLVFGHNDLLAANFIDDGDRIWLIDWDYAGFNSPLFDLGGLASNNELSAPNEEALLERYFEEAPGDELRYRYAAMKCASLLREAMWSMVSEHYSSVDFDFVAYTDTNLRRFEAARARFEEM
jgi:thiamine kinase-like enzyme